MTLEEPRPETPTEHDRRKVAPLEFALHCALPECELRVSAAARCKSCHAPLMLLCTPHSGAVPTITVLVRCAGCKAIAHGAVLLEVISLAGWV